MTTMRVMSHGWISILQSNQQSDPMRSMRTNGSTISLHSRRSLPFQQSPFTHLENCANSSGHGRGIAIQLNFLLDYGAFAVNRDGTFAVNSVKVKDGVIALTREFMTIQAQGDYAKAKDVIAKLG